MKGSGVLLTALNQDGKLITLVQSFKRKELIERLRSDVYFCPVCQEPLILKAGNIRVPHFSHKRNAACSILETEPESPQHLKGKKYLFDFFFKQGLNVSLEHYLPDIKQRPDLFVQTPSHSFAIEYQCSPIARSILEKRTEGYKRSGIIPIWIIGGKPYQKYQKGLFTLTDFHWSMIRYKEEIGQYLFSFDSESLRFFLLSNITPISLRQVSSSLLSTSYNTATLPFRFPQGDNRINVPLWQQSKRRWLQNKVLYGNLVDDSFLKSIYSSGHNPYLLPPICGLPVPFMECFYSHPIEWQFFIYQECFSKLQVGKRISVKYIIQKVQSLIKSGFISPRYFPLAHELTWKNAVEHYCNVLTEWEYFKKIGEDLFEMVKEIKIPSSTEEATKWEEEIFRKLENGNTRNGSKIDDYCFFFGSLAGFSKIK